MTKRPPTAYNFVTKDTALKEKLREAHPDWSHQEMMSEFARLWKEEFSEEEKQKYYDQAKEAKDNWTPQEDSDSTETTQKAKRAQSSYFHFAATRRGPLKQENPTHKVTDLSKLIGAEWKQLTEEDKQPFLDLHEKEKKDLLENPIYIEKKVKKSNADRPATPSSEEITALKNLVITLQQQINELTAQVNTLAKSKLSITE